MRERTATRSRRTHRLTSLLLLSLVGLLAACAGDQSALHPQGPFAERPHQLIVPVLWIALGVFVLVQGLIIAAIVKFRQRGNDDDRLPVQVHGNTKLEILWTVIPALILAGIAVPTVQMIFELAEEPDGAITIEVIGHRWWWEFRYPGTDIVTANEMVIPAGVPVHLVMTAEAAGSAQGGVIHSFWIPPLGGKQDVIPGQITTLNIQANEPGRYLGQCAEYCGLSHANMRARVVALEPAEYEQWLADQQAGPVEPEPGTLEAQGAELFGALSNGRQSCVACHAIGGENRLGRQGPDLTHLMSRREFAGAIFDLYERDAEGNFTDVPRADLLADWLRDPTAMKPMQPETGMGMPNLNLTEEEIDALVAYLLTLH